jgi:hypothetical protein
MNQDEIRVYINTQKQILRSRAAERPELFDLLDIQYAIWLAIEEALSNPAIPEDLNLLVARHVAEELLEECHEAGRSVYQDFLKVSQVEADRIMEYLSIERGEGN